MKQALWRDRILALRVFGVAWAAVHGFVAATTPIFIFSPLILAGGVPFLYGAFALRSRETDERRFRRAQRGVIVGFCLMLFADAYMTLIFPRFPYGYPVRPMMQLYVWTSPGLKATFDSPSPSPSPLR